MKWIKSFLLVLLFLSFTACSQVDESEQEKIGENQSEVAESTEKQPLVEEEIQKENEEPENNEEVVQKTELQPQYKLNKIYELEPIGDAPENVVLLTIDDAPDKYALEMANTLQELNVNAIFFVNGHFLDTDEEKAVLKEIHEMGFPIGNHTMTHAKLSDLSQEKQYEEIVGLNDLVEEIIGERPKFFRAPHGVNTDYSRQLAADQKMVVMNWSYGYDFMSDYMTKEAIADIMVNTELLRNGSNLLMHDREWTKDALQDIVVGLQDKGYEMADPNVIETLK